MHLFKKKKVSSNNDYQFAFFLIPVLSPFIVVTSGHKLSLINHFFINTSEMASAFVLVSCLLLHQQFSVDIHVLIISLES